MTWIIFIVKRQASKANYVNKHTFSTCVGFYQFDVDPKWYLWWLLFAFAFWLSISFLDYWIISLLFRFSMRNRCTDWNELIWIEVAKSFRFEMSINLKCLTFDNNIIECGWMLNAIGNVCACNNSTGNGLKLQVLWFMVYGQYLNIQTTNHILTPVDYWSLSYGFNFALFDGFKIIIYLLICKKERPSHIRIVIIEYF